MRRIRQLRPLRLLSQPSNLQNVSEKFHQTSIFASTAAFPPFKRDYSSAVSPATSSRANSAANSASSSTTTPSASSPAAGSPQILAGIGGSAPHLASLHSSVLSAPSTRATGASGTHAWGLLEACLESGNLERAEYVLLGFAEISHDPTDITLAVNNYLLKLAAKNPEDPHVALTWLNRMVYLLKDKFKRNSLTDAIFLKNAYTSGTLEPFVKLHSKKLPQMLNHVEILGVETVRDIVKSAALNVKQLDARVRDLLEVKSAAPTEPEPDSIAQPIYKGSFETLEPTQSAGLRSIRHVLSALTINSKERQELTAQPLLKSEEDFLDFFEMSKKLNTPEERQQFEQYLDSINERRQQAIETRGVEAARMRWKDVFETMVQLERTGSASRSLKGLEMMLWQWNQAMLPLINEEFEKIRELSQYNKKSEVPAAIKAKHGKQFGDRFEYGPFLLMAKPENLPAITMMALIRLNSMKGVSDGIKSIKAVIEVGKNVETDYKLRALRSKEKELLKINPTNSNRRSRRAVSSLRSRIRNASLQRGNEWPNYIQAKIGSLLISFLLREAKVTVYGNDPVSGKQVKGRAPAFQHTYQYQGGTKSGVLRPHKVVSKYLSGESTASAVQPEFLPMLVEPRPWTDFDQGGYYYSDSKIIRTRKSPEQLAYVKAAAAHGQLDDVYKGLNVLGRTPWTINKDMFRLISQIWNSKEAFLDIPPAVDPSLEPERLEALGLVEPPRDADPSVRRDYMRRLRTVTLENHALYSQRCDLNYKLDVARAFLGERFYMPHNLDFRGRAYPLSPHMNHLGNDVSRSLLIFWNGRKLGPNGLRWLKIHASNLFGNSKLSFDDRVKFIDDRFEDLVDSVENPLDGRKWWQSADDPFQALAALKDIKAAIDSDNPEEYVSHLAVHMDGSCNGLQHYAALGGDVEGAREVNLIASERPQDVYSRVLDIVKETISNEAADGSEAAATLLPFLSRKVVKQTVMTHVYGVTYIGAREQISNRLKELDDFPKDKLFAYSAYLASRVLGAVRQLFESAHNIQDWLADNATRISHSIVLQDGVQYDAKKPEFLSSVIWTTPLGLPIVQPYRNSKRRQVVTELQTVFLADPYSLQGVNSRKQRTAFPPNFVHSLDATHMLLSAIACSESGIDFASVHDSYWTHAGDVEALNANLRSCFVKLYSRDHIGRLRQEFNERYNDLVQVISIPADSEVGKQVAAAQSQWLDKPVRSTTLLDQIDIELRYQRAVADGEAAPDSPLTVISRVDPQHLEELMAEAKDVKRAKSSAAVARLIPKSTEHAGTGLDLFDETEEDVAKPPAASLKLVRTFAPLRIPEVPSRGQFDVSHVLESPYFFS